MTEEYKRTKTIMKKGLLFLLTFLLFQFAKSQDSISIKFKNQYKAEAKNITVSFAGNNFVGDDKAAVTLPNNVSDSMVVVGDDYASATFKIADAESAGMCPEKSFPSFSSMPIVLIISKPPATKKHSAKSKNTLFQPRVTSK